MAIINFGGIEEEVITSEEFSLEKAQDVLKNETVAVLGYGVQGPGQALNMKDNGINVIVGQREMSNLLDEQSLIPHGGTLRRTSSTQQAKTAENAARRKKDHF